MTHGMTHSIVTTGPLSFACPRRLLFERLQVEKEEFQRLLEDGVVNPSSSCWTSLLHIVPKSMEGGWRPCGDYRFLIYATPADRYPVLNIMDFHANLRCQTVFSKIKLVRAFHQIPMAKKVIPKTAIKTSFGLFGYPMMNFGLCNAAQTFQRFMDQVVRGMGAVVVHLDDILVASSSLQQHEIHLRQLFS
uniref:Reverse transcriptase domain-containing protein n=1 Tax=Scylla olivacea TaxID=85551 RepID=A0A0P4WG41_SCYOL